MKTNRRQLLIGGASAGLTLPLARNNWLRAAGSSSEDRILVVLQLRGGNDSVNCLAPAENPVYQAARPTLRVSANATYGVGPAPVVGNLYFHTSMIAFKRLFDAGKLAAVFGVGYPNHNLSHFQSEYIWYSADPTASAGVTAGWLGNYFRFAYHGGFAMPALIATGDSNPSFTGFNGVPSVTEVDEFTVKNDPIRAGVDDILVEQLMLQNARSPHVVNTPNPHVQFVAESLDKAVASSRLIRRAGLTYQPRVTYPINNVLNEPFQLIARYITGGSTVAGQGLDSQCYYLDYGGFDTHANQSTSHFTLLRTVADSVEAFINDLAAWGHDHRVVVMIWTEFARRFGENGSRGTDHGKAGTMFLAGKPIKGGFHGQWPDINKITPPYDQQHTEPTTDFRDVFSTVLKRWWNVDPTKVIPNHTPNYTNLGFL